MNARSLIWVIVATVLAAACSPVPPQYFPAQLASLTTEVEPAAINSVSYAIRPPLSDHPGYLETIKYIDNGIKYNDQYGEFFVSYDGQLCFRGLVNRQLVMFENYQNYWCMFPTAVNNVDAIENNVSYVNSVRLWCVHSAPQCARRFGYPLFLDESGWVGNSITVQIVPYREARRALEYLVYLMGGNARQAELSAPTDVSFGLR